MLSEKENENEEQNEQIEEDKKLRGKKIIKQIPKEEKEKEKEVDDAFNMFRNYLQDQGPMTVLSLARQFKIIDENGNKIIDFNMMNLWLKY